jgi:hypothetical protein
MRFCVRVKYIWMLFYFWICHQKKKKLKSRSGGAKNILQVDCFLYERKETQHRLTRKQAKLNYFAIMLHGISTWRKLLRHSPLWSCYHEWQVMAKESAKPSTDRHFNLFSFKIRTTRDKSEFFGGCLQLKFMALLIERVYTQRSLPCRCICET